MLLRAFLKSWALPPGLQLLMLVVAFITWRRWPRFSRSMAATALLSLYLLSLPQMTLWLEKPLLKNIKPLTLSTADEVLSRADVIVILGGGRSSGAFEFDQADEVSVRTLERLRYGAYLQRRTGLPVIVSGGRVYDEAESEASIMARSLVRDFGLTPPLLEENSRTTWENAVEVEKLMTEQGLHTPLVVTQAWHMPRSLFSFRSAGVAAIAAPTAFTLVDIPDERLLRWVPRARALQANQQLLHEFLGLLQYRLQVIKSE